MAEALIVKASDLLGRREDAHVEFTLKVDESGRFLESVVAFLNTDGGSLYFGVEDANAQAVAVPGVDHPDKDSRRILDMIADRIEPRPSLSVPERLPTEGGRAVLRLRVEGSRVHRHALRDGKAHVFCERVGDRNRAMSWSEVQRALADEPLGDEAIPTAIQRMTEERSKFLANKERTTLRVACWPVPLDMDRVDLQRHGKEIGQALWDASVVGVRSSGSSTYFGLDTS